VLFSALKTLYIEGESPQPPLWFSIHLDDAIGGEGEDRVMTPMSIWG